MNHKKVFIDIFDTQKRYMKLLKTFVDVYAYDFILSKCKTCKINILLIFVFIRVTELVMDFTKYT
ncbi:MAG: hypothetical protein A2V64_02775 [Bacteroidetes bacterium RBG_13_43_22]|nr:MAG: hypothetical protein A2V64_02775 [Bacteroidetes bacterium RBG_13_43_22]